MSKLTLNVDPAVVQRAKEYARRHGTSVSKLVGRYLTVITEDTAEADDPPILRRLRGSLRGAVPDGADYREVLAERYE